MAVSAAQQAGQFRLYETGPDVMSREAAERQARTAGLCEVCRMREARYGFRTGWRAERRTTLCFPCFRSALDRRQGALARRGEADGPGLDAAQPRLPLADTLEPCASDGGTPRSRHATRWTARARPSAGPAEGHRKSCQPGFSGSWRRRPALRPHEPARLPPRRHPRPPLAHGVAHRLAGGRRADPLPPRLPPHRRPQPAGPQTSDATQRCLNPGFSERIGNSRRTGPGGVGLVSCGGPVDVATVAQLRLMPGGQPGRRR